MVKKIIVDCYDGRLACYYEHWSEKMVITREKISYERTEFFKCKNIDMQAQKLDETILFLLDDCDSPDCIYREVKSGWSYKLDVKDDFKCDRENYLPIFEAIEEEIKNFDPSNFVRGCDIGDTTITVIDEDGTKCHYQTAGALSRFWDSNPTNKRLYELIDKLILEGLLVPYFM